MFKNPLRFLFLGFFSIILIWYTVDALIHWWKYESLTKTTTVTHVQFTVKNESSDKFFLKGIYSFVLEGKEYRGETVLSSPMFRNSIAAEEEVLKFEKKEWKVWYSPNNPEYSSLEKNYPFKEYLYASILWGLLIYFFWLGWKVRHGDSYS